MGRVRAAAVTVAAIFCGCLFFIGCEQMRSEEPVSETRLLLDTYCTITIYDVNGDDYGSFEDSDGAALLLLDEAFELCERLEALFSITMEGSDVWCVNHAGGLPVAVDSATIAVVLRGIEFGELSDGMFDISIGRLSRLWDFSGGSLDVSDAPGVPAEAERDFAQATVDFRRVQVDSDGDGARGGFVQMEDSEAWLDLGGIAKGYIADEIAAFLRERGVESALVDLGGDIVALGCKPDGSAWRLGVRKPFGAMNEFVGVLEVSDVAVVSSGVYERQFSIGGELYHHILNPFTGLPVQSDVLSATIIADDAVTGEGLSTIAVLVGSERFQALCEQTPGFIGAVLVLEGFEVVTFGEVTLS